MAFRFQSLTLWNPFDSLHDFQCTEDEMFACVAFKDLWLWGWSDQVVDGSRLGRWKRTQYTWQKVKKLHNLFQNSLIKDDGVSAICYVRSAESPIYHPRRLASALLCFWNISFYDIKIWISNVK